MKKRIASLFLALALCMGLVAPAAAADMWWNTDEAAQEKGYARNGSSDWDTRVKIDGIYDTGYVEYGNDDYGIVLYCTIPTRVTVLEYVIDYGNSELFDPVVVTAAEPMDLGGSMRRYELAEDGSLKDMGKVEPTYQIPVYDEEMEWTSNGAGTYWDLEEGLYYMKSVAGNHNLFLVVGEPFGVELDEVYISLSKELLDYVHITGEVPEFDMVIDEVACLMPDDATISINLPAGGTYFEGMAMLHFPAGSGDPGFDQPLLDHPLSSNGMYKYYVYDANEEMVEEFVYITESYAKQLTELGFSIDSLLEESAPSFTDVKSGDWFYDSVNWAVDEGITNGTGNNAFSPARTCTQGEILTFLWRAAGSPEPKAGNAYSNSAVTANQYYYKALQWAWQEGVVDNAALNPAALCQRSDVVTYLWKLDGSPRTGSNSFTDVPANAAYAKAVAWAVDAGITTGSSATTFSPAVTCDRGQIVTFLYRYFA